METLNGTASVQDVDTIRDHYDAAGGEADLLTRVTRLVDAMEPPVTTAKLAAFDQFHMRGLAATIEVGALLGAPAGAAVLDAGSGLGGPARHLAEAHGWHVTGIDLTPAYVDVARMLTERAGLAQMVTFEVGDLCALPFADASFDAAYTQHVVMNIRDRARVYAEIRRVLRPGGAFVFFDVLAADAGAPPIYPVPWAATPSTSTLLTEAETRAALAEAGLPCGAWRDESAAAVAWFQQRPPSQGPGLGAILGARVGEMTANFARNLAEGRIRLVMGRCEATAPAR